MLIVLRQLCLEIITGVVKHRYTFLADLIRKMIDGCRGVWEEIQTRALYIHDGRDVNSVGLLNLCISA